MFNKNILICDFNNIIQFAENLKIRFIKTNLTNYKLLLTL